MNGELDIGSARFHAYFPHDGHGGIPQTLVFGVGQGLGRRHRDGFARVHPHGIEILDGADDDDIVRPVPHDLEFIFLPAQRRLLQHDFMDHAGLEARPGMLHQLLPIVGHTASRAAQGK
ncbi:MAG: hypothetical protein A4E69_02647 [Syntrophus sp. PtaB.Bin138]|nr:MAG: hypothetical protein A4E69_02647 [Syntrophus sp. PtaB.Bin138]